MTTKQELKSFLVAACVVLLTIYLAIGNAQINTLVSFNTAQVILTTAGTGVVTGSTYALPGGAVNSLTWQITHNGSAISIALQASLDGTNWYQVDASTAAAGEIRNYGFNAFKFVRASQTSRTGGTSTVVTITAARGYTGTSASLSGATYNGNLLFVPTNTYTIGISRTSNAPSNIYAGTGIEAGSYFGIAGLGLFTAPSDGVFLFRNNAGNNFDRLQFGGTTSAFPSLKRSGAQLIAKLADDSANADMIANSFQSGQSGLTMSGVAFAALGTPGNGNVRYCSDCTIANPCAGAGTGAIAKRLNGIWVCN